MQKVLLLAVAALLAGQAQAQTRLATKAAARPTKTSVARRPAPLATKAFATRAPATKTPVARPTAVPVAAAPAPAAPALAAPTATTAPAGRPAAAAGASTLNLGIGFGLGYGYIGSSSSSPALSVAYMRRVAQAGPGTISVGALAGYKSFGWQSGNARTTLRNFYGGVRGAYHYDFHNPRLDTYAGLGLGLRVASYSDNSDFNSVGYSGTQLELSTFAGVRYFFSNSIGAFSELGYDMSYLKVGLSARF